MGFLGAELTGARRGGRPRGSIDVDELARMLTVVMSGLISLQLAGNASAGSAGSSSSGSSARAPPDWALVAPRRIGLLGILSGGA